MLLALAAMLVTGTAIRLSAAPSVRWICSTESNPWQVRQAIQVPSGTSVGGDPIVLDPATTYQTMDGFGGCFNELGWEALTALPTEKREEALKALFSRDRANFTLGRAPIGANDFSLGWYSLDEAPGDYDMKDFSIERTREDLVPYIKAAMRYQPALGIWAVPWCPPSWMTTNGCYRQGHMKQDPQTLAAYALYLSKFVQAWRALGINLYAIHPQNEPALNDNIYPQCAWTGPEIDRFLRDYLVPRLAGDHVDVEVWLGTIVNGDLGGYTDPVLGDPRTSSSITGVGYQYGGQNTLLATHEKYPTKKLAQTETECYGGGNSWDQAMLTFGHLIEDTRHFASSYFFWNMVLDESGLSRWNWRQNCLITVNRRTETVTYNPEYYAMRHFSGAVMPGARRIAVSGGAFSKIVAFLNPDGSKALIIGNDADKAVTAFVDADGTVLKLEVPGRSMNTFTFQ